MHRTEWAVCCANNGEAVCNKEEKLEEVAGRENSTVEVLVGGDDAVIEEDDVADQGAHAHPAPPVLVWQRL